MNTISILKDTNVAITSSEDSLASVRLNSYVQFGDDPTFYIIGGIENFFYIQPFTKQENKIVSINSDVGINLSAGDNVSLSYKVSELETINAPANKGEGYRVGDVLTLDGGLATTDQDTGRKNYPSFIITSINENGGVEQLKLTKRGRYYQVPTGEIKLIGGSGKGASVEASFRIIEERGLMDRSLLKVDAREAVTFLTLDSPLPEGVDSGKLSVKKWKMHLSSNYVGSSKLNQPYQISRDFTPFAGIPTLLKNSANPDFIYNQATLVIDKKFQEMQSQIDELKEKLSKFGV